MVKEDQIDVCPSWLRVADYPGGLVIEVWQLCRAINNVPSIVALSILVLLAMIRLHPRGRVATIIP